MTYEEAVGYISEIPKFSKKSNPEETRALLRELDYPERSFRVIHIAGTNGKGSVSAMLHRALVDAGVITGLFTSPHLCDIRERIVIGENMCGREEFLSAFLLVRKKVERLAGQGIPHPAYFEFLFAMAMVLFREKGVETAVLETGLGGRLDATNVVEHPELTVITSIGIDHTKYLGNTIEEIAAEKAGILKKGCPAVFDGRDQFAARVIRERCRALSVPYYEITEQSVGEIAIHGNTVDFSCKSLYDDTVTMTLPFPAPYQAVNGAIALLSAELLPELKDVPRDEILRSFSRTVWRGRMQEVESGIYLDGAHNPDGIRELISAVKLIGGDRPHLLLAQMTDKDTAAAAKCLPGVSWGGVTLTEIPGASCRKTGELRQILLDAGIPGEIIAEERDPIEAYKKAKEKRKGAKLFCAGSLYLIGELLKLQE